MNCSPENLRKMQNARFEIFKEQDNYKGCFDVTFEIEGKILHANRFILISVSETMASWLSSRWTKKDESVIIETCSYDDFYEFLRFLYSGSCNLTKENIFQMTDIAEFFAVPFLKELCDKFLSGMGKTAETIEEMYEIADKYSLPKLMDSIKYFIRYCKSRMFKAEKFNAYKKSFIEFVSESYRCSGCVDSDDGHKTCFHKPFDKNEIELFECVYKWAEHQVMKRQRVYDIAFNLQQAITAELSTILPNIKFANMNLEFLMDFAAEKGFLLSTDEFGKIFKKCLNSEDYDGEEESSIELVIIKVYKLAQKQAMRKQLMAPNPENFDVTASIKADFTKVIPQIKFHKLDKEFLADYVVAKGILTEEEASHVYDAQVAKGILTEEEASHVYDAQVQIKNNGKVITGVFKDDLGIYKAIRETLRYVECRNTKIVRFCKIKLSTPTAPSTVTKMKGVNWYLCLGRTGILAFKHYSVVQKCDYLLAEMKSKTKFELIPDQYTFIYANYNNLSIAH